MAYAEPVNLLFGHKSIPFTAQNLSKMISYRLHCYIAPVYQIWGASGKHGRCKRHWIFEYPWALEKRVSQTLPRFIELYLLECTS